MRRRLSLSLWSLAGVMPALCGCTQYASSQGGRMSGRTDTGLASLPAIDLVDISEVDLVEALARNRQEYRRHLSVLHEFYLQHGSTEKARRAQRELRDLRRVKQYRYLDAVEVPPVDLQPTHSDPVADGLYEDGLQYLYSGGHRVPLFFNADKMKLALEKFNAIILNHRTSDKADDAAFWCGEIHKEYFNDNTIAVRYYEMAFKADPNTPHPARFQAAVVYDLRMHDRDRALELYQDVLAHERSNRSNMTFATRRIGQLTDPARRGSVAPTLPDPIPTPASSELPATDERP